jgi:hypothetical protein
MGRSPRTVFPHTVTLEEAFRRILRAMFPGQLSLADKIPTRWGWELPYPKYDSTLPKDVRRKIGGKEVKAIKKMAKIKVARESFGRLVARKEIKLWGTLDPCKPLEHIDPADARVGVVDILAGELRVFLNGKLVRTYRQVHCYEADVRLCVTELRSETSKTKPKDVSLPKPLRNFTTKYTGRRTLKDFTTAAEAEGINATRARFNAALDTLGPRRRGRPLKSQEK